ncbi:MAG: tetratricopeptide repeat protein [Planctomycetota bacterium]|nr:tetratricopeptide repeat protein [Planctomycetota bacterium]
MVKATYLLLFIALLGACSKDNRSAVVERGAAGIGSAGCAECHAEEAALWRGSHHDLAMQHATPDTVIGDFSAEPFTWSRGDEVHRASFRQNEGRFFVTTEAPPDGAYPDLGSADANGNLEFEVQFTFGAEPLQQYLVEFPGGAIQCLPIAWDTQKSRWFHLDHEIQPGDALHWTGRLQRWNTMCAECHSTGVKKGYDASSDTFSSSFAEMDVGCVACHGEAEEHAELARNQALSGALNHGFGTQGDPARFELNNCAPCHSRRASLTSEWEAGQNFLDHFSPALLQENLYFPDGQIKDEVFVWGSFTQSRMHAAGVTCSDCHDPHSLQLKLPEGPGHNELCLQCHSVSPPAERFPTLAAKDYQSPLHHGHELGTEAARCTTCHMPERTYMKVDPRRDHSMGVPRPDLSLELGTPNACATCHGDDSDHHDDAWAAAAIAGWVDSAPRSPRTLAQRQLDTLVATAFSRTLELAELSPTERAENYRDLSQVLASTDAAPLQRATSLDLLARFGAASIDLVVDALDDRDPLVRAAAAGALRKLPQTGTFGLKLRGLHADPVRMVRVAAAEPSDFERYRQVNADFPTIHFESGLWAQVQGRFDDAETDWRRAIELDPDFMPATYNLSVLLSAMGRGGEAAALLREAVTRQPEEGELHYSLALQLAELQESEAALASFQRAAALLPERPRVAYNLGLIHSKLGQSTQAERELRRAIRLYGDDAGGAADATYALAIALLGAERNAEARQLVNELHKLGHTGAGPLLDELDRRKSRPNQSADRK